MYFVFSYRVADALFTVIEESEHEAELSPAALHRRMSSEKGSRPKLVRMPNTVEDPGLGLGLGEDDIKSDLDYLSAASSLSGSKNPSTYNSSERPIQVYHGPNENGDELSDTCSTISGGNTTYGSPISSPSSPTYWTPSQGSSSQVIPTTYILRTCTYNLLPCGTRDKDGDNVHVTVVSTL